MFTKSRVARLEHASLGAQHALQTTRSRRRRHTRCEGVGSLHGRLQFETAQQRRTTGHSPHIAAARRVTFLWLRPIFGQSGSNRIRIDCFPGRCVEAVSPTALGRDPRGAAGAKRDQHGLRFRPNGTGNHARRILTRPGQSFELILVELNQVEAGQPLPPRGEWSERADAIGADTQQEGVEVRVQGTADAVAESLSSREIVHSM